MKGFKAGTLVTTKDGPIPIEKLKVGDLVLTHTGKYEKILEINKEKVEGCYRLQTQGSPNIYMGKDQELFCVEKTSKYDAELKQSIRSFSSKKNKKISKMETSDFICIANNKVENKNLNKYQAWAFGKFVNNGSIDEKTKEIIFYLDKKKLDKKSINYLNAVVTSNYKNNKITIRDLQLFNICKKFSKTKMIPYEVMSTTSAVLVEFIKSYSEEAAIYVDEYYLIKSINKPLIYQIGQVVSNISNYGGFSLFWEDTKVPSFRIQYKDHIPKSANFVRIKNKLWQPIRQVTEWRAFRGTLYSLTIENANSYIVDGIVAKC